MTTDEMFAALHCWRRVRDYMDVDLLATRVFFSMERAEERATSWPCPRVEAREALMLRLLDLRQEMENARPMDDRGRVRVQK